MEAVKVWPARLRVPEATTVVEPFDWNEIVASPAKVAAPSVAKIVPEMEPVMVPAALVSTPLVTLAVDPSTVRVPVTVAVQLLASVYSIEAESL